MRYLLSLLALACVCSATSASATPYCQPCPYSCRDLGLGSKDCSFISDSKGVCCVDLTRKGLELADAQEKVREQQQANQNRYASREQCPPGFRPSEQKCSQEERRRGCKDMRLPGGLGCVRR